MINASKLQLYYDFHNDALSYVSDEQMKYYQL